MYIFHVGKTTFQLLKLTIGETAETWSSAGFEVMELPNGSPGCQLGSVQIQFNATGAQGILSAVVFGLHGMIDSLQFDTENGLSPTHNGMIDSLQFDTENGLSPTHNNAHLPSIHPNGVSRIDHLVVTTTDCDRTTDAFEANGILPRRVRTFGDDGSKMRQTFFWLGDVILELVGPHASEDKGQTKFWGLALISDDLRTTADYLGSRCTPIKPAVQSGRKITTIKTREIGITTPLAVMSPHTKTD
mgnify:CR=1 FL=1